MIYTCTMNLAIDLYIKTLQMKASEVNRTEEAVGRDCTGEKGRSEEPKLRTRSQFP